MKKIILSTLLMAITVCGPSIAPAQQFAAGINLTHDVTFQLVQGDLTASGTQYSAADTTGAALAELALYTKAISLSMGYIRFTTTYESKYLIDCYFDLTCEFRSATNDTVDVWWKPQARNINGTWTDLADWTKLTNPGLTYTESSLSGYATLSSTFNSIPFDVRVLMRASTLNEGIGRVKSGSYVRAIFRDLNL